MHIGHLQEMHDGASGSAPLGKVLFSCKLTTDHHCTNKTNRPSVDFDDDWFDETAYLQLNNIEKKFAESRAPTGATGTAFFPSMAKHLQSDVLRLSGKAPAKRCSTVITKRGM